MKRTGNVLPFPMSDANGNNLKLFAVIFYLVLAYLMTLGTGLSEDGIGVLLMLGIMYNFLVRRRWVQSTYFQQNKVILIILLVLLLLVFKAMMLLILVLASIYWLLVGRHDREAPYFLRFHIVTALILNFFILMPYLLFSAGVELVYRLCDLFKIGLLAAPVLLPIQSGLPLLFMGIFWGAAVWLSISAVMGRTPYISVVTDNVRHWA